MAHDERPTNNDTAALEFLRRGRPLEGLSEAQIDRIERRLRPERAQGGRLRRPLLATVALLLVCTGAAVAAGVLRVPAWLQWTSPSRTVPPVVPKPVDRPRPSARAQAMVQPAPDTLVPMDLPTEVEQAPPPVAHPSAPAPSPRRARSATSPVVKPTFPQPTLPEAQPAWVAKAPPTASDGVRPSTPPTPDPPSPLVIEGRSMAGILSAWHKGRDARATLRALDAHEARFPDGQMRIEARVLRAEVFLSLGREREALAILDELSLHGLPRQRELRTLRGELRVKFGRCEDGLSDLHILWKTALVDSYTARAQRAAKQCE